MVKRLPKSQLDNDTTTSNSDSNSNNVNCKFKKHVLVALVVVGLILQIVNDVSVGKEQWQWQVPDTGITTQIKKYIATGNELLGFEDDTGITTQLKKYIATGTELLGFEDDTEDGLKVPQGIMSQKSQENFFQPFRDRIDASDLGDRCRRYSFPFNTSLPSLPQPRRIFYGSLISYEAWELFDIVATETRNIFTGMVFVESNRTQNYSPRPFKYSNNPRYIQRLKTMFAVEHLQIRQYINEENLNDPYLRDLTREAAQREEIVKGWKELGMTPQDVGYIADVDETFSRDFLKAIMDCPYIEALDYNSHHCFTGKMKTKIIATGLVFETAPDCIREGGNVWYHPDMIIGACIEQIGNPNNNILAPRQGFVRKPGYGRHCNNDPARWEESYGLIPKNNNSNGDSNDPMTRVKHPLWSATDFRMQCGGQQLRAKIDHNHSVFTAFHLHNFFVDFQALRHKYLTYGHPKPTAMTDRLENISSDLKLMVRCVFDQTDAESSYEQNVPEGVETQQFLRVRGGVNGTLPPWPIYFEDADYRRRKHEAIRKAVLEDEQERLKRLKLTQPELEVEQMTQELNEAKRKAYDREQRIQRLRKEHNLTYVAS